MLRTAITTAALVMLCGCSPPDDAEAPRAVALEQISPDFAVKSWWRLWEERQRQAQAHCEKIGKTHPFSASATGLTSGRLLESVKLVGACDPDIFNREIVKVDIESETRAIVLAQLRNVTPTTEDAQSAYSRKERAEGVRAKYVLERADKSAPWQIADIFTWRDSYDRTQPGDWGLAYDPTSKNSHSFVFYP